MTVATVLAIVFAALAAHFAFWCLVEWIVANSFIRYMRDKGYEPPSEAEMKECIDIVFKEKLRKN